MRSSTKMMLKNNLEKDFQNFEKISCRTSSFIETTKPNLLGSFSVQLTHPFPFFFDNFSLKLRFNHFFDLFALLLSRFNHFFGLFALLYQRSIYFMMFYSTSDRRSIYCAIVHWASHLPPLPSPHWLIIGQVPVTNRVKQWMISFQLIVNSFKGALILSKHLCY